MSEIPKKSQMKYSQEDPLQCLIGKFEGTDPYASERIDEVIYAPSDCQQDPEPS